MERDTYSLEGMVDEINEELSRIDSEEMGEMSPEDFSIIRVQLLHTKTIAIIGLRFLEEVTK